MRALLEVSNGDDTAVIWVDSIAAVTGHDDGTSTIYFGGGWFNVKREPGEVLRMIQDAELHARTVEMRDKILAANSRHI